MSDLLLDFRHALRTLRKAPGFAAVAVLTLTLGVASGTAIFSVIDAVMIRPLPGVADPGSLVWITKRVDGRVRLMSYPDFEDQRANADANGLAGIVAFDRSPVHVARAGREVERLEAERVSGDFFAVVGVPIAAGRGISEADDGARRDVAVLSHAYWQRRFDGSRDAVGAPLTVNGRPYTIVGVASPAFLGFDLERVPDVFLPLSTEMAAGPRPQQRTSRDSSWLGVVGRLAPRTSAAHASLGVSRVAKAAAASRAPDLRKTDAGVEPLHGWIPPGQAGEIFPLAIVGLAASGLVLLIAAANVANLLLGRSVARSREIAVRAALGASRGRIVRMLLAESVVLSLAAAAAALALSGWGVPLLLERLVAPPGLRAAIDGRVLGFSLAVAVGTGLLFGLAPALAAARRNLAAFFQARQDDLPGQTRAQQALVVAQVALSLVLLSTSGLFLRSLSKAASVDVGLDRAAAERVLAVSFDLETQGYGAEARDRFRRAALERAESLPGVASAALAEVLPLTGRAIGEGVRPAEAKEWDYRSGATFLNAVSPGYFATLGIPIVAGRDFTASDRAGSPRVAIVNETLARQFWPGESPLGKRVRTEDQPEGDSWEVVGVARDGRYVSFTERPRTFLYRSILQHETGFGETVLLVRSAPGASLPTAAVRDAFRSLDPGLPLFHTHTLAESIQGQLRDRQQGTLVISIFGAMALVLAAAGLYAVVSYSVARRMREIGIRVALGASRRMISGLFLRRGAKLAVGGVSVGLVLSAALTRLLTRMLFGVEATDALTFAAVAAALAAVALAASWIPARRAARVDPIRVLKAE